MLSSCAALLVLCCMGSIGTSALRRFGGGLSSLEVLAFGAPLGIVFCSLAILALAIPFGLSAAVVASVAVAGLVAAISLWPDRPVFGILRPARARRWPVFAVLVLALIVVRWCFLFRSTLTLDAGGLWAGHRNIWADWAQHLGDVTSFAYGGNFPPSHPRLAGAPFAYHYLTSITVAAMVALGMSPIDALPLHSFVMSILLALGVYAFAKRLTQGSGAAALTVVLFFVGGGLGWVLTARDLARSNNVWNALIGQPWDAVAQQAGNYRWLNVFFSLIYPQRSFLYGLPIGLLVLTLLLSAVGGRPRYRNFFVAGLVAGLLPFAHLGTLLALAMITPFLFLLFPSPAWIVFFGAWVAVAVPQLWVQQGGGPGAAGAIRLQLGWVAGPDAWWWFWLKNLGAFIPLLGAALVDRDLLSRQAERMLWAFMPIFVAANLVVFQPWDWDNSKFLAYWFLAVCVLVSAVLAKMWREYPHLPVRIFLVATVLTMTLSGLLENFEQMLGRDRRLLLTREEVDVAAAVRRATGPHAVFAAGLQHNHPIPVLSGRRVIMGYPGWMWSQGTDTRQREHDLREMMAMSPAVYELMARYGVDYVVIGPNEKNKLGADLAAYRRTFRTIVKTDNYDVFDVKAGPDGSTSSSTPTSGSQTPQK